MDRRFSHLRRRDSSVAMLRVKMSGRISLTQKENRGQAVAARRRLDNLLAQEANLNTSVTNTPAMKDITNVKEKSAKNKAFEERLKQLARWKERKALQKEKQKQERERKGVFKTGLYHPKDTVFSLPPVPAASKAKEPLKTLRSKMAAKKDQTAAQRPTGAISAKAASALDKKIEICAVGSLVRGHSTRLANRTVTAPTAVQNQPKDTLPAGDNPAVHPLMSLQDNPAPEEEHHKLKLTTLSEEDTVAVDTGRVEPLSFAPEGFVFQPPAGLEAFSFAPLKPRSADRFLAPMSMLLYLTRSHAKIECERQAEPPRSSPRRSTPPPPPLTAVSPMPSSPLQPKHDVAYFRSQVANESDRLTSLCDQWQTRVEDESLPEEMRGRVRTTVGQARLLMKERFNQFGGLLDDCELRRGAKLTTCSDLEGFWDMVYFQVEDVHRKFDAVKEAEVQGWVEEPKAPSPRQKKAKLAPASAKPTASNAGARPGLAAVKAAMRAQKKAADIAKAAGDATDGQPRPRSQVAPRRFDVVVFDGGFFCVESPAKTPGCMRRSSRLSAATPPHASSFTNYSTSPRRASHRSVALAQSIRSPVQCRAGNRSARCSTELLPITSQPFQRENADATAPFSLLVDAPLSVHKKKPAGSGCRSSI